MRKPEVCRLVFLTGIALALALGYSAAAEKKDSAKTPSAEHREQTHAKKQYWIGVALAPVRPELRAQLNLPDRVGLVIADVVDGSPAQKAGLRQYDVIVRVAGKDVTEPQVLVDAVQEAGDSELTLEIIRNGRRRTVKVKPAERPKQIAGEGEWPEEWLEPYDFSSPEQFRKLWERLRRGYPLGFRFFGQPYVFQWEHSASLPKNLTITITKQGDQPACIVVKRDGKRWEVTEDELEKLPPDVRRHVQRMLGRGFGVRFIPWGEGRWEFDVDTFRDFDRGGSYRFLLERIERLEREKKETTERLEKKLGEASEEIESLEKQLRELKEQLQQQKPRPRNRK